MAVSCRMMLMAPKLSSFDRKTVMDRSLCTWILAMIRGDAITPEFVVAIILPHHDDAN